MIGLPRPVRFLAVVLGGWTAARVWLLWPALEVVPEGAHALAPPAVAAIPRAAAAPVVWPMAAASARHPPSSPQRPRDVPIPVTHFVKASADAPSIGSRPAAPMQAVGAAAAAVAVAATVAVAPPPHAADLLTPAPIQTTLGPSRLSASAWLIARRSGAAVPFAGQLGGSQAGVRVLYALGEARRLSLAGRIATPLGRGQREAALGVDWRPFAAPIHLFAEQRFALGRGRGGPTAGVIAGLDPTPIALGLRLEGYGQAGAIGRDGVEGFADGALRLGAPVARHGGVTLDLGVGAWGGGQRGARRLDLGPAATLALPLGDRPLRLSLEWRQRVAGDARPGSGPALTLGRDF